MRQYMRRFYEEENKRLEASNDVDPFESLANVEPSLPVGMYPGYTLTQIIDQFYTEGVVPNFIPADLGEDGGDEVGDDGYYTVDPLSDLRSDPFEMLENHLIDSAVDRVNVVSPDPVIDASPEAQA